MRTMRWLVGDLQGCARELDDLLEQVRFDPGRDELWSVGDLINRGPDSLATLRLWRDVGGKAILGNHEIYAIRAHAGTVDRKRDTLDGLFSAPDAAEWMARLSRLPVMVRLEGPVEGTDVWAVHAGMHPRWSDPGVVAGLLAGDERDEDWWCSENVAFATRARCCTPEGKMSKHSGPPEACPEGFSPWDRYYRGPERVVHGHWAARGYYRTEKTLGLDSGCVYGGPLTAWCHEEDRIEQVPSRASGHGPLRFDLGR